MSWKSRLRLDLKLGWLTLQQGCIKSNSDTAFSHFFLALCHSGIRCYRTIATAECAPKCFCSHGSIYYIKSALGSWLKLSSCYTLQPSCFVVFSACSLRIVYLLAHLLVWWFQVMWSFQLISAITVCGVINATKLLFLNSPQVGPRFIDTTILKEILLMANASYFVRCN